MNLYDFRDVAIVDVCAVKKSMLVDVHVHVLVNVL